MVPANLKRGGFNVLSIVTNQGRLQYSIKEETIDSEVFVGFLKALIYQRERPLILLMDQVSFHHSKAVCEFVRQHRAKLRVYFLPRRSPEMNPDLCPRVRTSLGRN